jgi:hypothetical protein
MKRRSTAPVKLDYPAALRAMFRGSRLVRTNDKRVIFDVSPGGPVTDITARRIIEHSLCRACDPGLLPDAAQSWAFTIAVVSDP